MHHHLFFGLPQNDGAITLDSGEAHHAMSVLRAQVGDSLSVTDGSGSIFTCVIDKLDKKSCLTRIVKTNVVTAPLPRVDVFIGMPQRESFETALRNLTGLGVSSITPVVCGHCQTRWWEDKWEKHALRYQRIMIASMKQSMSAFLPALNNALAFDDALKRSGDVSVYADDKGRRIADISPQAGAAKHVSCFVGPPGGFAPEEIQALNTQGSHALWLGPNRLRTELAATAAVAVILQTVHSR